MGDLEGIGEAVTGGLLARAVEPGAGEARDDGHTHERHCLNCATLLSGRYCFACGQKAHVHRSLRAFMGDFVAGLMNFEGKFWRTLPMLAWRPGEMTRRYIAGERARFISPVALYLFTVFAMFAVLNFTGTFSPDIKTSVRKGVESEIAAEKVAIGKLETQLKSAGLSAGQVAQLNRQIKDKKAEIAVGQSALSGNPIVVGEAEGVPEWVKPLIEAARQDPELAALKIQEAASKYSWLLIPISVPFLWLLFPFSRRYRLYDHTVFVTYSLSFMMILVIAGGLLVTLGIPGLATFLFFVPPVHMYRQLKGAYQLGRTSALLRTIALMTFAFIAGLLFLAAAVAIGTSS